MVCAGSPRARLSASTVTNMVWRSGEKMGDLARFSAKTLLLRGTLQFLDFLAKSYLFGDCGIGEQCLA
jgi:hypothetical protein